MTRHGYNWSIAAPVLALVLGFSYMIVDATLGASVMVGIKEVAASAWGRVTLIDLGVGLVFVAFWMAALLGVRRAAPWIVALFLLGNLTLLIFVLMRLRHFGTLRALLLEPRAEG